MYSAMYVYMLVQGSLATVSGGLQSPARRHEQEGLENIVRLSTGGFK